MPSSIGRASQGANAKISKAAMIRMMKKIVMVSSLGYFRPPHFYIEPSVGGYEGGLPGSIAWSSGVAAQRVPLGNVGHAPVDYEVLHIQAHPQ